MKGNGLIRSQAFAVRVWFRERDALVFDDLGPLDRYLAELLCVSMADGWVRGGRPVHVERALIVPWVEG